MSGVANTPEQVENYASCTLLSASLVESPSQKTMSKENSIQSCVKFLEENEFIRLELNFCSFLGKWSRLHWTILVLFCALFLCFIFNPNRFF